MASIPWLADVLREAGVSVVEEGDWRNRGTGGAFDPIGVLWHHTAGNPSPGNPHPSLGICINGRSDLAGPLCHALVDYNGVFHIISANSANHAGPSGGSGPIPAGNGNAMLIGWEIEYNGVDTAMTPAQYGASVTATAAVLRRLGKDASYARGHRETSTEGKPDPAFVDLDQMRADVAARMISRFAFVNSAGQVIVKDGSHSPWENPINGGGASKVVLSGQWIGIMTGDTFWAKSGIFGNWVGMAAGAGMRDIAISGDRFAFVNAAGQVLVKDGVSSPWPSPINGGGASKVVLSGGWIGVQQGDSFLAKSGIQGSWRTMADAPGLKDIAIDNNRFAFVNGAGQAIVKDGVDSPWPTAINPGGATRVVLKDGWIGVLQGGDFLAKFDIFGGWKTMASGGQVSDIALGGNGWFGFVGSGNFLAKQGADSGWLQMAPTGSVRSIALET
ncbi:N-acetylmuramoyl-L-alanine amidase [Kribbella ginsengisoli]|uniref:N-acetylmuramoyl-L-alanine amidase domain-containing protein n=1 Tax=Kribbella ginsengisoli TaxID=363865 RepID=A0ABP6X6V0_9ACTN